MKVVWFLALFIAIVTLHSQIQGRICSRLEVANRTWANQL